MFILFALLTVAADAMQRMPVGDRDFVADGCESPFQLVDRGETHAGEDLKHTTREILEAFQNFL
jgi:hypothetical protein